MSPPVGRLSIAQSGQETFNWGALSLMRPVQGKSALAFGVGWEGLDVRSIQEGRHERWQWTKGRSYECAPYAWHLTSARCKRRRSTEHSAVGERRVEGRSTRCHSKYDGHTIRYRKNEERHKA